MPTSRLRAAFVYGEWQMPELIDMLRASLWGARFENTEAPDAEGLQTDLKATLQAAGVKFHHKTSADKLAALLEAFKRSGLTGEAWNALPDAEKAQFYEAE